MDYIKLAENGDFVLLVTNMGDERGIVFNIKTGKKWEDKNVVSVLARYGWELISPKKVELKDV